MASKKISTELFKEIPAVNDLLKNPQVKKLMDLVGSQEVKKVVNSVLDVIRRQIVEGKITEIDAPQIIKMIKEKCES